MGQSLIVGLTQAHLSGHPLPAAEWVNVIQSEADAYAVQDGVAACALTPEMAGAWVDAMAVSVELVGSRWTEGLEAPALLRMADHQSNAGLLLGPWEPYAARDWSAQTCQMQIGDKTPVTRTGSHSLNDPAWLLPAWLQHLTRHGTTVPAGAVVTTGSWVGCLPVQKGDCVRVVFTGLGDLVVQV